MAMMGPLASFAYWWVLFVKYAYVVAAILAMGILGSGLPNHSSVDAMSATESFAAPPFDVYSYEKVAFSAANKIYLVPHEPSAPIIIYDILASTYANSSVSYSDFNSWGPTVVWDERVRPLNGCPTGCAYFIGERHQGNDGEILRYDPSTDTMTSVVVIPWAIESGDLGPGITAQRLGSSIYIFAAGYSQDRVLRFNIDTGTVTLLSVKIPHSLESAASAANPALGRIYLFGGVTAGVPSNEIFVFNAAAQTIVPAHSVLPAARIDMVAQWDGWNVILFGGYESFSRYCALIGIGGFAEAERQQCETAMQSDGGIVDEVDGTLLKFSDDALKGDSLVVLDSQLPLREVVEGTPAVVVLNFDLLFWMPYEPQVLRVRLVPGQPLAVFPVPTPTGVNVVWLPPSVTSYSSRITATRIYRQAQDGSAVLIGETNQGDFRDSSCMTLGCVYHVAAVNGQGEGALSDAVATLSVDVVDLFGCKNEYCPSDGEVTEDVISPLLPWTADDQPEGTGVEPELPADVDLVDASPCQAGSLDPAPICTVVFLHGYAYPDVDTATYGPFDDLKTHFETNKYNVIQIGFYGGTCAADAEVHGHGSHSKWEPNVHVTQTGCNGVAGSVYHSLDTDIRHLAYHLAWKIYHLDTPVDVVAHSMGGLLIRYAASKVAAKDPEWPPSLPIEDVVTIATPHTGTGWGNLDGTFSGDQLDSGSDFMKWLNSFAQNPQPYWAGRTDAPLPTQWSLMVSARWGADIVVSPSSGTGMTAFARYKYSEPDYGHMEYLGDTSAALDASIKYSYSNSDWMKSTGDQPHAVALAYAAARTGLA